MLASAFLAMACTIGTGCATNPAPAGWLAPAREAASDPYGAWIEITRMPGSPDLRGEFLGVARDSVFVLDGSGNVETVAIGVIRSAKIAFFDSRWPSMAAYAGALSLATISNGFLLILTLPTNLIVGSVATASQSREPLVDVTRPTQWDDVRRYARFPAALPDPLPRTLPTKRHK
ncbi:MAG TPA: hypothetical protein VFV33_19855 [Gemmatimonadaceae bacterium]|nr:hypothetical protein [Gemmatimonadaceae bacterium]